MYNLKKKYQLSHWIIKKITWVDFVRDTIPMDAQRQLKSLNGSEADTD